MSSVPSNFLVCFPISDANYPMCTDNNIGASDNNLHTKRPV